MAKLITAAQNVLAKQLEEMKDNDPSAELGIILGTAAAISVSFLEATEEDLVEGKKAIVAIFEKMLNTKAE